MLHGGLLLRCGVEQLHANGLMSGFRPPSVWMCKHQLGMRLIKQRDSWDSSVIIVLHGICTINTNLNECHERLIKIPPVLSIKSSLHLHHDANLHKFILSLRPHSVHRIKENLRKLYDYYRGLSQQTLVYFILVLPRVE
jgi:hypothetical protein